MYCASPTPPTSSSWPMHAAAIEPTDSAAVFHSASSSPARPSPASVDTNTAATRDKTLPSTLATDGRKRSRVARPSNTRNACCNCSI